ncbi:response regulator [Mahella australiensis]|uniref:Stage 0 sporulation protein A homolog n=1 Tax=Mahella australiensis (strain DSM 15567 / CIP 107919 / 50-1 BON) TaxID=697281 RepID=F4A337_MAHA5|nr:response regulator [Mahella australiensis]AEE96270.1 two component transcriptional regulator, AraC family [Mahella australiensis 50-1 BON]
MSDCRITVLIVDDEYLERNLVKRCIDWNALNLEIIGEASNADDALKLIESLKPDIIFTDIRMPGMDGIEFSKIALQKWPDAKIVILTAYNDFDYAQMALKIGVSDFLLKPIDDEEVLSTATKLKALIETERSERNEFDELKKQIQDNLPYLRERFLNELISGSIEDSAIDEKLTFFGIAFNDSVYQIAALSAIGPVEIKEENRLIQNLRMVNYVRSYFKKLNKVIVFVDTFNRIIILSNNESLDLYKICIRLKNKITKDIGYNTNIGIGNIKSSASAIKTSYKEAIDALNYCAAAGVDNIVMCYRDIQATSEESKINNSRLRFCLKSGLENETIDIIKKAFSGIDAANTNAIPSVRITALDIISICCSVMLEVKENFDDLYLREIESYRTIINAESVQVIVEHVLAIAKSAIRAISKEQADNMNNLISDIKRFIKENISDPNLSLSYVAKHFYLNPSYLSRMFKKETGITFIEYLINKRMEKAISLLKEKNMKSFEIANAVGINDPNYFSSCFKKYTGLNVSEYKKLAQRDELS